jgi:hypothetical protein
LNAILFLLLLLLLLLPLLPGDDFLVAANGGSVEAHRE